MKATDRQLIDISEELTAYIMKPTSDLHLNHEECIILNKLITEEFERRQEQDVMGSSNGQDTSLGQTGADNNDDALDASECRDNEASGTPLRKKKKPQITKVSKKEYWDNMDKHGVYEIYDMSDEPESHFGKEPYEEPEVPYLEQNYCKDCVHYSRLHHVDGMGECDHCSVTVWGDQLPCFGFERISSEDTNGNHNEATNEKTEEKIWKIPPILQAIIKDVHFVLCTETTEEYKDIFEVGKIYPTRGNNNGIHIIGIAGHGDPYDLLCHTWGDENGCEHHPAELGDELPPTFIPLGSLDLGTFQFPIDT